jgi:RNA polymerase sigma-70 factor (ECF subfamily)
VVLRKRSAHASGQSSADRQAVNEFEQMVRRVQPFLAAYAKRRLYDSATADDVVAETLSTAWRRWNDVPRDGQELAYLYGIERRVLSNQKRSIRRQQSLVDRLERHHSLGSQMEQLTDREQMVAAAFGRLRESDQELLTLSFWEDLSCREIGVTLGCSENAATIRLHRARRRLEQFLGDVAKPSDDKGEEAS